MLAPLRWSLCLCWGETHTKDWGRDLPRDWKWRKGGRSERRQRDQSTTESRRDQSAWDSSPGEGRSAEGGSERRQWVSIPSGFVEVSGKIHARDSLQMHKKRHKIVTQTSFSCAWSWPKSVFVHLFFFSHPLDCALHICNEMCNIPSRKWEKTTRQITGYEKFGLTTLI